MLKDNKVRNKGSKGEQQRLKGNNPSNKGLKDYKVFVVNKDLSQVTRILEVV